MSSTRIDAIEEVVDFAKGSTTMTAKAIAVVRSVPDYDSFAHWRTTAPIAIITKLTLTVADSAMSSDCSHWDRHKIPHYCSCCPIRSHFQFAITAKIATKFNDSGLSR